ncbi:CDP-glucose 4,6-dehydratase [Simkania negevensis]|uniref:CDP-glucose 4,6-dehydratase n=1 Tax=Simkania negevensis TaxID=83561 RepID=A0ABS3ARU6_9BACT|nr:CDP-glucose 4,6-dehydratase [Simkania negevensis]
MTTRSYYQGKRVLITGHTGFKGGWLALWLLELGAEIIGISIDPPTKPSLFEITDLKKRICHYTADIRHYNNIAQIITKEEPQLVFHLAAQPLVRPSYDNPRETFDTNVSGTVNLLEAIRHCKSIEAAVIVTTDKCYENVETLVGYQETDRLGGKDPYSASKACAELVFRSFHHSFFQNGQGVAIASARAGNVIGGGDWAEDRIVADIIRAWPAGASLTIRSPESVRPWQHVLEPLSGYLLLGQQLSRQPNEFNGQSFNFGPRKESVRTVQDLLSQFKKHWPTGETLTDSSQIQNKREAGLLMLNIDKAARMLDWRPLLSFEESIAMTAEWYHTYYQNKDADMAEITLNQIRHYEKLGQLFSVSSVFD